MKTHITTNVINEKEKINILLISGVHGNELTSIKALSLFSKNNNFKYRSIKTITCIHGINIEGIRKCVRDIPKDDNNDLNRMFKDEFNPFEILKSHIEKNELSFKIQLLNEEFENLEAYQNNIENPLQIEDEKQNIKAEIIKKKVKKSVFIKDKNM